MNQLDTGLMEKRARVVIGIVAGIHDALNASIGRPVSVHGVEKLPCPNAYQCGGSFGQPITQYDPKSAGAADYRALAQEIISQEGS